MGNVLDKLKVERYSLYKDSEVEWLEKIPMHWKLLPTKRVHKVKKQLNTKIECDNVLSLTLRGVVNNDPESPEGMVPNDYRTYQIFEKENLVFKLIDLENVKTSRVGIVHEKGIMSSAYIRLVIGEGNFSRFSYYYYYSLYLNQVYNNLGSGVRSTLGPNDLLNIPFLKPANNEQIAIAAFLDRKTALIVQAIDIKQKQIELLKERRQILIRKAVTRGLNPNVKMKDSGVESIGKIPEHWEVKRLKDVCSINLNALLENTNSNFVFNYVDIGSVSLENGIFKTEEYTFKNAPSRARRIAKIGDTIISTVRTYLKAIDFIDEVKSSYIYSTGFAILQPMKFINPEFIAYFVRSDAFTVQVTVNSKGMSYPAINSTDLGRLTVVHCEEIEQQMIIEYIKSNNSKISTSVSLIEQEIEKLKEYKAILINSAVTGKIKVYKDDK